MSTFRALALTGALFLVSGATAPDTIVRPAKFDYTMTTLPNGLQVVFLEDHSTPIVHLALWYHVGSKDEKAGRTGFAHLFEHLMFKGSRNVRPDQHPSWITSIGGEANAVHRRRRDGLLGDGAGAVPAARRSGSRPTAWPRST